MKLKTMKDIFCSPILLLDELIKRSSGLKQEVFIDVRKIIIEIKDSQRQEAINHIKSGTMVEGAKSWAIKFFNLKEEELK